MKKLSLVCSGILFLSACSQGPAPVSVATSFVPTDKVQSILLAQSEKDLATCESELRAQGAKVLYRNDLGLMMTDRAASALALTRCAATVAANAPLTLEGVPRGGGTRDAGPDLPTLLNLIPAEEIGARSFVKAHPNFDGRNVVIAILDTGIELDHPMLKSTPNGSPKILDFEDFSGEGRVDLAPVAVTDDHFQTSAGGTYSTKGITGTAFAFGVFKGSTLSAASELAAGDTFSDIGVLAYQIGGSWRVRIDTDGDKDFSNEAELYDFQYSRLFTKIGAKRSLTTSVNIAADGKSVSLCFDDGSHGTHVGGIAAGFEPNGLQGVAPGAQIVLGKIGDNRLSGGSTTTASMLLAIDFAVQKHAQVVNLSYGIRAGSNLGKSTIDRYVDKVAREKGVLFSISAGNEGPGLLTVGTPAGAALAITNAAYISKETAHANYGYVGVQDDNTWFFSSVGPLLNGGWRPTLLAPGTAVSSVPGWLGGHENYRGTSMASPEVTGGLALLLSGAIQQGLPTDRATITQAVYAGAKPIASLTLIEQGHGLMSVPQSFDLLAKKPGPTIEYMLSVNSSTSPEGTGAGIYVRARQLPMGLFTVTVAPVFAPGAAGGFGSLDSTGGNLLAAKRAEKFSGRPRPADLAAARLALRKNHRGAGIHRRDRLRGSGDRRQPGADERRQPAPVCLGYIAKGGTNPALFPGCAGGYYRGASID